MRHKDRLWALGLFFLKKWSRAGLMQEVERELRLIKNPIVLSVGGYGPVDKELARIVGSLGGKLITFDLDANHFPELLGNVEKISEILKLHRLEPDVIVALEVFEHVQDFQKGFRSCNEALSKDGLLIISTPWIIPIHDRPHDYHRFTPQALKIHLRHFPQVKISARGKYIDSVVALMLRGLFSGGIWGKLVMAIGIVISLILPKPKTYDKIDKIDSCIGYVAVAKKNRNPSG
jgi:hypothetical protein